MFLFHVALSLGMISLTAGTALFAWSSMRKEGAGMSFAKLIGVLVIIFSILSILCTTYYGVRAWREGHACPMKMMQNKQMQNQPMMDNNNTGTTNNNMTDRKVMKKIKSGATH